ncbi:FAD-dependent monooxygenase [Streptomyces sp. SL13]|uniref:FAD-dependent monooxygenase n=1 Tax=Streptantibioticus silvisoli TaxID=2705255 RepID=A0AA90H0T2_9ACTN|nr:FAD-dependent monooxygenase [Streptantibioticus silvisoli]MDI5968809.1 FAD-dependent monooxygenase [Streptantibioticus silvisoli]
MTRNAVVVGGSVTGLATALALSGRGWRVRVLERSAPPPDGPPRKAALEWDRPLVPQSGHSQFLQSLGVHVLREHAAFVLDDALEEGGRLLDLTAVAPPAAGPADRAGDEQLEALGMRRPVLELLLLRAVRALPGVTVGFGTAVRGLLMDADGGRATGVVTGDGSRLTADVVIDATGRAAMSRSWLAAAGVPVEPDESSPSYLRAYTRFYRLLAPGALPGPLNRGNAAGGVWDHYAAVVHPADGDVFAITLGAPTADPATTALRRPGAFTAACRLSPFVASWVDPAAAVPLTDVRAIAMPANALRGVISPRQRPVAGLFAVGDAAGLTDPLYGRGVSLALRHAFVLAGLLDDGDRPSPELSERAMRCAYALYRPWYEQSVHDDDSRERMWRARLAGEETLPLPPVIPGGPPLPLVAAAAATDRVVWRALVRGSMSLDRPADLFGRPELTARLRAAPRPAPTAGPRPPSRGELLAALASEGA